VCLPRARLRCWLGLHKWDAKDIIREDGIVFIYNRCCRADCPRYSQWRFVHIGKVGD
jgi:hypothetical protein